MQRMACADHSAAIRRGTTLGRSSGQAQRAVVIAVIPVRMMQVPVYQVIDVIIVRNSRMAAVGAMNVVLVVALAVVGDAPVRVGVRDRYYMLLVVVFMGAVQVPVVQVPHMVLVLYGNVTAVRAVFMSVILVDFVSHDSILSTSSMNRCVRVGVLEDIVDERLYMSVHQSVIHVPAVAPARHEVLLQKDSQAL